MKSENLLHAKEFSQGNFKNVYSFFSDEIEWNIVGTTSIHGKESVTDFCNNMLIEMASSVLTNNTVIEQGNQIVIEGKCRYFNEEEKECFVYYCDVYLFENDKIKQITSYCI